CNRYAPLPTDTQHGITTQNNKPHNSLEVIGLLLGMHRYHFFTNRYEYEYFYLCTCRYRVPIPILLRFGLHESAINLEADFILSSADYVKPMVQNSQNADQQSV